MEMYEHGGVYTYGRQGGCTFEDFPHSIDTTGVHKQGTPFFLFLMQKMPLTMYASYMNVIISPHPTQPPTTDVAAA